MKTLASFLIVIFLGLPLAYIFLMKEGKYQVMSGYSILDFPLATDSIAEDTINNRISFTDLNFHNEYTFVGNYVIKKNKIAQ